MVALEMALENSDEIVLEIENLIVFGGYQILCLSIVCFLLFLWFNFLVDVTNDKE